MRAIAKGRIFRPPKYYDALLEKTDPDLWKKIHARRAKKVRENPEQLTDHRKNASEEILKAKQNQYGHKPLD